MLFQSKLSLNVLPISRLVSPLYTSRGFSVICFVHNLQALLLPYVNIYMYGYVDLCTV